MRTNQLLQLVRILGRGKRGIVGAVVLGVIVVGTWWLQDGAGEDQGAEAGPSASAPVTTSAAPTTAPTTAAPSAAPSSVAPSSSNEGTDPASGLPYVDAAALPPEAADTLQRIDAGGPYRYPDHDDATFHNFEGILPDEPDGYYREYTVETPGLDHRGARRIVTGEGGEFYWTSDHYESFSVIVR